MNTAGACDHSCVLFAVNMDLYIHCFIHQFCLQLVTTSCGFVFNFSYRNIFDYGNNLAKISQIVVIMFFWLSHRSTIEHLSCSIALATIRQKHSNNSKHGMSLAASPSPVSAGTQEMSTNEAEGRNVKAVVLDSDSIVAGTSTGAGGLEVAGSRVILDVLPPPPLASEAVVDAVEDGAAASQGETPAKKLQRVYGCATSCNMEQVMVSEQKEEKQKTNDSVDESDHEFTVLEECSTERMQDNKNGGEVGVTKEFACTSNGLDGRNGEPLPTGEMSCIAEQGDCVREPRIMNERKSDMEVCTMVRKKDEIDYEKGLQEYTDNDSDFQTGPSEFGAGSPSNQLSLVSCSMSSPGVVETAATNTPVVVLDDVCEVITPKTTIDCSDPGNKSHQAAPIISTEDSTQLQRKLLAKIKAYWQQRHMESPVSSDVLYNFSALHFIQTMGRPKKPC